MSTWIKIFYFPRGDLAIAAFFALALGAVAGAEIAGIREVVVVFGVLTFTIAWNITRHSSRALQMLVIIIACAIGILFGERAEFAPDTLAQFRDTNAKTTITGTIVRAPKIRERYTQYTVNVFDERVLVSLPSFPVYTYGDTLTLNGLLASPESTPSFDYPKYLRKEGIQTIMRFPEAKFVRAGDGNIIRASLIAQQQRLTARIRETLPINETGLLVALLTADESLLSEKIKNALNTTGLRHLIAVSGMHIAILTELLFIGLVSVGLWRKNATYAALALMTLYTLFVGAPASAVRAFFMAGITLSARLIGRAQSALRFLLFASVIMIVTNPFIVRSDIGFQLSFLATLGIILIAPLHRAEHARGGWFAGLRSMFITTIGAQIATAPILLYNFGMLSLISPIANLLAIPAASPTLFAGFIGGIATMIFPALGSITLFPVFVFLRYLRVIAEFGSTIPFAVLAVTPFTAPLALLGTSALAIALFYLIHRRERRPRASSTTESATAV